MNDLREKLRTFFKLDLKKFIWYIITEPFRIVWRGIIAIKRSLSVIQRIQAWMFIFGILTMISILAGNLTAAKGFGACFILSLLHHEWQRGLFRKRWKDKEKQRIIKIIKNKEAIENGRLNTIRERQPGNSIRNNSINNSDNINSEEDKELAKEEKLEETINEATGTTIGGEDDKTTSNNS
jgi:hypothetical protein